MLGGGDLLRGYDFERFRDRVAALGTLQYEWDLSQNMVASLFTDAGRVYSSVNDLTFDRMRVGFGASLSLWFSNGLAVEGTLGSSIDGGIFTSVSFNPVFDARPRWR